MLTKPIWLPKAENHAVQGLISWDTLPERGSLSSAMAALSREGVSVMDILHKSGHQPTLEDHELVDEWTGFMRMRKPQKRDGLTRSYVTKDVRRNTGARSIV